MDKLLYQISITIFKWRVEDSRFFLTSKSSLTRATSIINNERYIAATHFITVIKQIHNIKYLKML